jgi:hypothetical protein
MIRLYIICEGQTEETFCNRLLLPYLAEHKVYIAPSSIAKKGEKGGTIKFERLWRDVRNHLLGDPNAYCTTFFDFYGLPADFPGKELATQKSNIQDKHTIICENLVQALVSKLKLGEVTGRFIPYVQMYEFEALLFSYPQHIAEWLGQAHLGEDFQKIRNTFASPEEINDSTETAPSKRILNLFAKYRKVKDGTDIAEYIGLQTIRQECHLFDTWLQQLESLA